MIFSFVKNEGRIFTLSNQQSMKLVIDIGNTLVKYAVFDGDQIVVLETGPLPDWQLVFHLVKDLDVNSCILSCVRKVDEDFLSQLRSSFLFVKFGPDTPIPIKNCYASPETLGPDRLAAAVAGYSFSHQKACLVIDAGTCIKYDFVNSKGEYMGGAIAPGLEMRLKALHTFTGKLPLIPLEKNIKLLGQDTRESILSGVVNGTIAEVQGMTDYFVNGYEDVNIILSGGDLIFFDKKLKNSIFAIPNIVLHGLNKILQYNEKQLPVHAK